MTLLRKVERFMRINGLSASGLGRAAIGDPNFVGDLRRGRVPFPETIARVEAYMRAHKQAARRRGRRR